MKKHWSGVANALLVLLSPWLMLALSPSAKASIAYGSLNNFDAVNDTGVPCHGFEIEIDDIHSRDITYTYDWNHYGVPKITEDNTDPLHPKVFVRYESAKNPDGAWAAYTAVPSGPIAPTDGHQFTDPTVNFGGEHFGVGFYGTPTAVKYNWLIDDGAGHLIYGGAVNIATPTFTYIPPAPAVPAQVQAVIVPPPPPELPVLEFGEASWVKETSTTTHNNQKVELRDLVSDDPNDPNDRNWQNGEPAEVEVEWRLFQTEFNAAAGGANGEIEGVPEDLPNGDEVVTRRYDFFKYVGLLDPETGEALADEVGPDGIHGVGDYADVVVVGDYIGAQMAGFDPAGQIGLIDHLQDGEINAPYVERTIVIGGTPPIATTRTGALPDGMSLDEVSGVLSGTPTVTGTFTFTVHSTDAAGGDVSNTYNLTIIDANIVQPLHITVTTLASPAAGGSTFGGGEFEIGTPVTVVAASNPGFAFVNWTDGGTEVGTLPSYTFTASVNRELVANFNRLPVVQCQTVTVPAEAGACVASASVNYGSYDPDADRITMSQSPPGPYSIGTTPVTLTVTDSHGASASCQASVTVVDTQPPVITCPGNVAQATDRGACSAVVNYAAPTASHNCSGVTVTCTPPSGSAFQKGTTTVTCTATDAGGLTAHCSFTVTIEDAELPSITCPADINIYVPPSQPNVVVNFPDPTASDNCPGVTINCAPPSGSMFPVGATTVTCTATDASGHTTSCSFTVTVTTGNECPFGKGYWKNNPNRWPVDSLTLGNQTYTKKELLAILHTSTAGDASLILARQLIATLLNMAYGSDPTPISDGTAHANQTLGRYTGKLPYRVNPSSSNGQAMVSAASILDKYNKKLMTPNCQP